MYASMQVLGVAELVVLLRSLDYIKRRQQDQKSMQTVFNVCLCEERGGTSGTLKAIKSITFKQVLPCPSRVQPLLSQSLHYSIHF